MRPRTIPNWNLKRQVTIDWLHVYMNRGLTFSNLSMLFKTQNLKILAEDTTPSDPLHPTAAMPLQDAGSSTSLQEGVNEEESAILRNGSDIEMHIT